MSDTERLELRHGDVRAVFTRTPQGWTPDWFYEAARPMLRFKDHEWLSIGHVKPTAAASAEPLPDGGAVFRGQTPYGRTPVDWAVTVRPDAGGPGFVVECAFTPAADLELLEAFTAFETPYEYDGNEHVTTVIGMNPVSRWQGGQRLSPPIWENPAWLYSRPQAVRRTGPCHTPYLCQVFAAAGAVPARYVTIIGDWTVCRIRDVYATPTRSTAHDPDLLGRRGAPTRGYKYLVGALNWSSAFAKDPNVLFAGGETHRQRVIVSAVRELPGGSLDRMLLAAWERTAALSFPADGHVLAAQRAAAAGVTWRAAATWLRDVICSDQPTEGFHLPGKGICTYAPGSRPKAGGDYGWFWWTQWAGPLHYRALLTGDAPLEARCRANDERFAAHASKIDYFGSPGIANKVSSLPSVWWVYRSSAACRARAAAADAKGKDVAPEPAEETTPLREALRPMLQAACQQSAAENGKPRAYDSGAQASLAEALILGAAAYRERAMLDQALVLLDEMAHKLDGNFWEFNVGQSGSLAHGGQIRSLGHGHAVVAHLLAWQWTGKGQYLARAQRFARYLLAVSYATHDSSRDPDFDWRGWCNGSNAGRDQIAEFPPWETQNGLLCLAALMTSVSLEGGFYDALWYIARTGLAQFPAARRVKRVLDQDMQPVYVPRGQLASERDFYDVLPYLAYENPYDQTLQASYQGTDCLLGELVYGGGLARAADPRLGVIVPRAAMMYTSETEERVIHLWNPLRAPLQTTLSVTWPDGQIATRVVEAPPREVLPLRVLRQG